MKPFRPKNETARVAALRQYRILDTSPEQAFDDITQLASQICGTPVSLITFIDAERQWIKSKIGLSLSEYPRDLSFCAHAILQPACFIVQDALADKRFFNNPLVASPPSLRFYAGVPLIAGKKYPLGTLCIADYSPRSLSRRETEALERLADQILSQLESRRRLIQLKQSIVRQRRVEKELRESQERFNLVARATNDVVWEWNLVTNKVWWNNAVMSLFGYSAAQIEPTVEWWYDRLHPEDKERIVSGIHEVINRRDRFWSNEYRFARGDGSYADIYDRGHLVTNRKGEPVRMIRAMMDITQKKRVERALEKSERRFRAIFDQAAIGISCVNAGREIIEVNRALERMLDYSGEEMVSKKFDLFTHPDDVETDVALFEELFKGRKSTYQIEKRYTHKNGTLRWGRKIVSLVHGAGDERPFGIVMIEDITEQKRIEEELIRLYETFEAVIKASPLAIVILDRNGTVRNWNAAAERIFGWEKGEVLGRFLPIVPEHKRDEFVMLSRQVLQGKAFSGFETVRQRKDGLLIDVSVSTALLRDSKRKMKEIVALFEDISERKKREKMIKEMNETLQQKNARIEELSEARKRFFSYISHELKTPLNNIVGFTSLLLGGKHGAMNELQSNWCKKVLANGTDLAQLINNILDLARMESGKMKVSLLEIDMVDLAERVAGNFRPFFEEKGLFLEVNVDPALPKIILTDPAHTRSLLSNLLSNAMKFTEKGGSRIELKPLKKSGGVRLTVSDTGRGIHPENLKKLFEEYEHSTFITEASPAYTGGTGLGLAIVKKIVDAFGGKIEVATRVGEGTAFSIELPEQRRGEASPEDTSRKNN